MEQATNQFNAGLQMDTHPMVQGNDTLTDALNATLITMNGNEVVLQNDMGNRRVDNAFLPAGYEPVGIKEYGGIIYIAAYNPITNKSQIGSFPSPERKISPDDIKDNLKGSFDFSSFESSYNTIKGVKFLKSDTILVPLTKEETLHAGDKFVVYSEDLASVKDNITNYDNTGDDNIDDEKNKVLTPKNKKYTLSLGVLNSQNEFVDITKTLCRWNGTSIKEYTNKSDLFIFNDAYFIATGKPGGLDYSETQDDLELIKERQIMPANTYAYKLVGPLYLKAELNHIQDFNFNIYGVRTSSNGVTPITADLYIEAFITYNCPDWITTSGVTDPGDDNYVKYELGKIKNGWFDLFVADTDSTRTKLTSNISIDNSTEVIYYDVNTNIYTAKVVKKFGNVTSNSSGLKYYTLGVLATNSNNSNIYLQNLSQEGVIDFSKLGSGDIDLLGWRFHNNMKDYITTLTYTFDAYPKYGYSFKNLKFQFENVNNSSNKFTISNLPVYNGRNTIEIDWGNYPIIEKALYQVNISVQLIKNEGTATVETSNFVRWFLSTPLMNDCYTVSSDNFISDYGNPTGNENTILNNKLKVSLGVDLGASNNSWSELSKSPTTGKWIGKAETFSNNEIYVEYEHKMNVDINISPKAIIKDKDLYPSSVKIASQGTLSVTDLSVVIPPSFTNIVNPHGTYDSNSLSGFVVDNGVTASTSKISGVIKFYDKFKSKQSNDGSIEHPFGNVDEYLKPSLFSGTGLNKYGGLGVDYDAQGGSRDEHYLNVFSCPSYTVEMEYGDNQGHQPPENLGKRIGHESKDGKVVFTHSVYRDEIFDYFNEKFENQMCFFAFESEDHLGMHHTETRPSNNNPDRKLQNVARVWFKSTEGWAVFSAVLSKNEVSVTTTIADGLWKFIKKNLFKDENYIYCFAESINFQEAGMVKPDSQNYVYNNKYTLDVPISAVCNFNRTTINPGGSVQCKFKKYGQENDTNQKLIQFTLGGQSSTSSTIEYDVQISSLEEFQDSASTMIENGSSLSNVYISTGQELDADNQRLLPTKFYKNTSQGLKKDDTLSSNIQINTDMQYSSGYYGILWKGISTLPPSFRYDVTGWDKGDHWTLFDYQGIKTI